MGANRLDVLRLLDQALSLNGRALAFSDEEPLLGALPELDSMAVLSLLSALEGFYGFVIEDDEVDGQIFKTVGALIQFVESKLS